MTIINVMWSGGDPYASVHKVHQQILAMAGPSARVQSWLLRGEPNRTSRQLGDTVNWRIPARVVRARGMWRLLGPWLRVRLNRALVREDAQLMLLDGVGVARVVLPAIREQTHIRAAVIFHGTTRFTPADRELFQSFEPFRLDLVAVSETLAHSIETSTGLRVTPLRSALDPAGFRASLLEPAEARAALGIACEGKRLLGAVGRLVGGKGFDHLINSFAQAVEQVPDLALAIFGEGPDREMLQQTIDQLGMQGRIFLPGHRDDLDRLYRGFDWVLIPSRSEGLGLVLQEAVLAGVPVLASNLAVFREQLGSAGRYAQVGDERDWVRAIVECTLADGRHVAAQQSEAMAPDEAWQRFRGNCRHILGCSEPAVVD